MEPEKSDGRLESNQKSPPKPLQLVTLHVEKRAKVYQEPVKRVRAKNPKSRTGCGTCKIRRVKCDEQKPTCLRCQKAGMICDGYGKPVPTTFRPRVILPVTTHPCHRAIVPLSDRFQSADEYQYILHFREQSVFDLAGSMPTRLWNIVLLRASNDELALRSLTMAIAAICKAQDAVDGTLHHQFALRQYGRALREIQTLISARQDTDAVRISLIASLLIFCFQSLNGDHEQAVEHVKMALGLTHQRFHTQNQRYSHLRRESSISELDDEIVEVFIRLDLTVWSRGGEKTQKSTLEIRFDDDQFKMPTTFQDVSEGQRYLRGLQHHAMPYLAKMTDVFMYRKSFTSDVPRAEYEEFSSKMQEWTWAFAPVLARALKGDGDETFIAAATLRSFALSNYLCVQRVCLGSGGESLNLFEREGQEIIDLTRRIVNDRRFKKMFVFDCGVVPALFITFMICRKRSIREEAIRILNLAAGRLEMTWDARTVTAICEKMLKAEDEEGERERKELGDSAPPSSLLSERHEVSNC